MLYSVKGVFSPIKVMISKRTGKSAENLRKYASVEAIILRIFLSVTASSGLPNLVFLRVFTSK